MDNDCTLRCQICGQEQGANFSHSLRMGWGKHCGYVMRLKSEVSGEMLKSATEVCFLPVAERSRIRSDVSMEARERRR